MNKIINEKCSFDEHKNINASGYCSECNIYVCEKCKKYHMNLVETNHSKLLYNKENNDNNEFCNELNHYNKLEYFCKTHNKLCCIACITKIKGEGNGQHSDCYICFLKDIKEEKISKLKQNILYLEEIFSDLDLSFNKMKEAYEEIEEKKENLKIRIQKLFTKLRNDLNKREDKLLFQVELIYEKNYFNKNFIKDIERMSNQIQLSIDKGKNILKNYNNKDTNLGSLIYNCIQIEEQIDSMNLLMEKIDKYEKNKKIKIDLKLKEEEIKFLMNIKNFGDIYANDFIYQLKHHQIDFNNKKYIVLGPKDNIIEKIVQDNQFTLITTEYNLQPLQIHKWKIKILNSKSKLIMVGITKNEQNSNINLNNINGWYLYCYNSTLYSGQPHNYKNKETCLDYIKYFITVIFDMKKGNLKFISDNKEESYSDIPLDKPLYLSFLLYDKNDRIEIDKC